MSFRLYGLAVVKKKRRGVVHVQGMERVCTVASGLVILDTSHVGACYCSKSVVEEVPSISSA